MIHTSGRDDYFLHEALLSPEWRPFCVHGQRCLWCYTSFVTLRDNVSPHLGAWLHMKPTLHAEAGCSSVLSHIYPQTAKKMSWRWTGLTKHHPSQSKRINTCRSESYYLAQSVDQSSFRGKSSWEANWWTPHCGGTGKDPCAKVEKRADFMKWSNMAPRVTETLL